MGIATLKMKNYAEAIADYLGIDPPDFDDFEETSAWIDEHRMEYLRARRDNGDFDD